MVIVLIYNAAAKIHVVHQDDVSSAILSCISQLLCIENLYLTLSISFGSLNCATGPIASLINQNRIYIFRMLYYSCRNHRTEYITYFTRLLN